MDLCGDMLLEHLPRCQPLVLEARRVCPPFLRCVSRLPVSGGRRAAFNADRLINRFIVSPRHARRQASHFDLFHVVDHTYSQLVHALPAERTGVYCHDLDAFRCLFDEAADPRPFWFRAMAHRILSGLRKAAVVFHSTAVVGEQIKRLNLVDPSRLILAPLGVSSEFTPEPTEPVAELPFISQLQGSPWALHVGSSIPRKRIDLLLDVVAAARRRIPELRLVKIGGDWSTELRDQIKRLDLGRTITHVSGLTRLELAEVYRRANVALVPSESEGFGLPVIEALACGTPVIASDIPTLREAGGPAAVYAPVGDVDVWSDRLVSLLRDPNLVPARACRLEWSRRFSWTSHADTIARTYHQLMEY